MKIQKTSNSFLFGNVLTNKIAPVYQMMKIKISSIYFGIKTYFIKIKIIVFLTPSQIFSNVQTPFPASSVFYILKAHI